MKANRVLGVATGVAVLVLAGSARAQMTQTDRTLEVRPGTRVELDNTTGDVTVRTWERAAVRVQARHPRGVTIEADLHGSVVEIDADVSRQGVGIDYTLTVPPDTPLEIDLVDGSIDVAGTRMDLDLSSVNGNVSVQGGGGAITLESVQGTVSIRGARGTVEAQSVNAGVEIRDVVGDVKAEAVNGRIRLTGIDASHVTAESVNGAIAYQGAIRKDGWYRFSTHNGGIDVTVPEGTGATFTASTFNGTLETGFPVTLREAQKGKEFSFTLGSGGARIELESFNGTMRLHR